MKCSLLVCSVVVVQFVFGLDTLIGTTKNLFKDFNLCNIPFDKNEFNNKLKELTSITSNNLVDLVMGIEFYSPAPLPKELEYLGIRLLFLISLLNNPNSSLCIALQQDPTSYFNYLRNLYTSYHDRASNTESKAVSFPSGKWMFEEVFVKNALWNEIAILFKMDINLKYFHFPTTNEFLIRSNLFELCSNSKQKDRIRYFMIDAIGKRIDEYVAYISTFQQTFQSTDPHFLEQFIVILSDKIVSINKFHSLLLFKPDNPLSKWIIDNYGKTIKLKGKAFVTAYLSFIFNPIIYEYIFTSLKSFNSFDKLKMLFKKNLACKEHCFVCLKSIIFEVFSTYMYPIDNNNNDNDIWIRMAYLSHSRLDIFNFLPSFLVIYCVDKSDELNAFAFILWTVRYLVLAQWLRDGKGSVEKVARVDSLKSIADSVDSFTNGTDNNLKRIYLVECLEFILKFDFHLAYSKPPYSKMKLTIPNEEIKKAAKVLLNQLQQIQEQLTNKKQPDQLKEKEAPK